MSRARKRPSASRTRTPAPRRTQPLIPGWLLLLFGVAIGVLFAYHRPIMELLGGKDRELAPVVAAPPKVETSQPVATAPAAVQPEAKVLTLIPPPEEHKYEFYYRLPKEEVMVDHNEFSEVTKSQAPLQDQPAKLDSKSSSTGGATPGGAKYLIQAGSFRTNDEAERRKAQLALLGVRARIENVTTDSGKWYRVRLGPFASLTDANQVQSQLHSQQIKTLLVNASGQ